MIEKKFGIVPSLYARPVLFDAHRIVLLDDCSFMFRRYGAEGFPFTNTRFTGIFRAEDALWNELITSKLPPWKKLFGAFGQVSTTEFLCP